jgi:hypothetical protein
MKKRKDPNRYPPGLDAKKVARIIAYYDARQKADLAEEVNHQLLPEPTTWLEVPMKLVPRVRELLAQHKKIA